MIGFLASIFQTVERGRLTRIRSGLIFTTVRLLLPSIALCEFLAITSVANADVADFYRGKQIRVVVGSDAGGGYDTYARVIASYLGKYIPGNPTFIIQNMPGVGSMIAINHIVNVAPKDGTVIGAVNPGAMTAPLFRPDLAKYDPRRFNWLGTPVTITYTAVVWHTAPVQTFDQLFTTELIVASGGGASRTLPLLTNGILGTKFKIIHGYKSASATMLAIERGEAQGNGGDALNNLEAIHSERLRSGRLRIIASYGLKPHPTLQHVPIVMNYAKTQEQRQALLLVLSSQDIGWPYIMAAGVSLDRANVIRNAFEMVIKDPNFRAEAVRRKLEIIPAGADIQAKLINEIFDTPREVVERVKGILGDQ